MSDWTEVYRGLDQNALALIATPGLVRRAAKTLEAGSVSWGERGASAGLVRVGGVDVQLDGTGPASARCPCPATGTCLHILAASLWLAASATAAPTGTAPTGDSAPDGLEELLALDPSALFRAAGVAATRRSREYLDALPSELAGCRVESSATGVAISLADRATPVLYVTGAGFAGMISDAAASERAAVHLGAIARVFASAGRDWSWPTRLDAARPVVESVEVRHGETLRLMREALGSLLNAGLAHATEDSAERLAAVALRAKAERLPLLARLLGTAESLVSLLADRADESRERDVALALAQVWALGEALLAADDRHLPALIGSLRRDYSDTPALELVPLGASWWTTPDGTRGVTLVVADRAGGETSLVTTARPAGNDPQFRRSIDAPLLWGSSIATLIRGPFRLSAPRVAPDGTLSPSGGTPAPAPRGTGFDRELLANLAEHRWSDLAGRRDSVRFGAAARSAVLLAPESVGAVRIDESAQEIVWPLVDGTGTVLETRIPVGPTNSSRIEALLAIVEAGIATPYVLVHAERSAGRRMLQPSSVFVAEAEGLRLYPLDFVQPTTPRTAGGPLAALRARFSRLLAAPAGPPLVAAPAQASPARRVCLPVLDVLEELCATGRTLPTSRQREILSRQAALATDLALDSIARAIRPLAAERRAQPGAVYRCLFVVGRALDLAAD